MLSTKDKKRYILLRKCIYCQEINIY